MMTFLGFAAAALGVFTIFYSKRGRRRRKSTQQLTALVESRTRQPTLDGNVQLLPEECSFFTHENAVEIF